MNISTKISIFLIFVSSIKCNESECIKSNGTTANLKEIFFGRCYEYFNKKDCSIDKNQYDCVDIWHKFSNAVIGKKPCDVKIEDYDDFVEAVDHEIPVNKTLFWSGTYSLAQDVTNLYDYWPLEKSLSGHLLDGLNFCSNENELDFIESSCPRSCVYRNNPFWDAISIRQASKVSGVVTVLLSGTRNAGAFASYSTFYRHEVPNLDSNLVSLVKVLLIHEPGKQIFETCKIPKTLKELESKLNANNIAYECEDNPKEILRLICLKKPDAVECQISDNKSSQTSSYNKLIFFTVSSLILLLL